MSRRGSKRRQVVQLDASSSNLHRYGYSKSFTSIDKTASSLKLLEDYSESESEESVGDAENVSTDADFRISPSKQDVDADQGPLSVNSTTTEIENPGDSGEKGAACMDDELKNFLSEIEAIPMPTDLQTVSHDSPQESPSPAPSGVEEPDEPAQEPASAIPSIKADKKKGDMYSMFIKGDTEFADPSDGKGDGQVEQQKAKESLDIPEEPTTQWQMVQDEATHYYYYWNWHTNDVTWEIPADYTQYLLLHKEYEEKIAKYKPEEIEAFKEKQQQKQKFKSGEIKSVPTEESSKESLHKKIGPQLPNGSLLLDHEEEQVGNKSYSGHGKKRKGHKKHKKRRHKDGANDDEPDEPVSKSSTRQTEACKQLPQLLSIVPYLSDEEIENKDIPSPKAEHDVAQRDPLFNPLPSNEKEYEDSIDSLLDLNAETKDTSRETLLADENSKTDQNISEIPFDKDPNDDEREEEISSFKRSTLDSEAEILPSKDEKTAEKDSPRTDRNQMNISNLNSEGINIFPQLRSLSKDEDSELAGPLSENRAMSEKDGDASDCQKTEQAAFIEDIVPEPENGKQEMEDGEISDSNDVILKRLDADKIRDALPNVENQKNLLSGEGSSQGKNLAETLLNLIDYKSDESEEEEDEEEEGELREYKSQEKEKERSSKYRDSPSDLKEKDESLTENHRSPIHKTLGLYSQGENLHLLNTKDKTCDPGISSSHLSEGNKTSGEVDDTDINFDDVEDIDRVLEMALEKKLDKRKIDEGHGHLRPSATSKDGEFAKSIKRDQLKQFEEINEKVKTDESNKGNSNSMDSDDDLQDKIKSMADLALDKLDFLEVGATSLSKLQMLYVELQTRIRDWNAGGLSTNYIYHQLQEAEGLIEQYEVNAVPDGWLCQWDRIKRRYFYRNTLSNEIQLEYPLPERKASKEEKKNEGERRRQERERSEMEESHRQHTSSRSSRHRKKEDKERGKHDRRSSDRHRKKRRRHRNHSSNSDSSNETSHQHHHKNKRKKRRKFERSRSPSVEIVEDFCREHVPHINEDSPPSALSISAAPLLQPPDENSVDSSVAITQTETTPAAVLAQPTSSEAKAVVAGYCSEPDENNTEGEQANVDNEIDGVKIDEGREGEEMDEENGQKPEEKSSTAIISKPPQIIVPPHVAAMNIPELYSFSSGNASITAALPSQSTTTIDNTEELLLKVEDSDKAGKKRKKEKAGKEKTLATGSSLMMKKKRVSSMVQKWQQVKKEVEKEDLAKELRQAAIREQINQLK